MSAWTAILAVEGQRSGDGRLIEPGAIEWDPDDVYPLMISPAARNLTSDHDGNIKCGWITAVRREGPYVVGMVCFDAATDMGLVCLVRARAGEHIAIGVDVEILDVKYRPSTITADTDIDTFEMRITNARLLGATVTPSAAFPQCGVIGEAA